MNEEIDFRPHPTQDVRWSRPPLNEVPMWATQAVWKWAVPGGWEERVAAIIRIECSACSLWYRAYEDDPRPCPGCSRPPVPEFPMRELEAARRVVNVIRDRKATLGNGALSGVEQIRALVTALDEYVAACGGPAAAMKIMEQVEKERKR